MGEAHRERGIEAGSMSTWFNKRKEEATIQTFPARLDEIPPWEIKDGKIVNRDPKTGKSRFFEVIGTKVATSGREVDAFGQPGLYEIPDESDPDGACGTVGLLVDKKTGDVLVTATPETFQALPGSPPGEYVALRASLQGSFTNIAENKVPLSEHVNPNTYKHFARSNPSRIYGKIRVGYTFVNRKLIDLKHAATSAWFSVREIEQGIRQHLPFNNLFDAAFNYYSADMKPRVLTRIKQAFGRLLRPGRNKKAGAPAISA